jgi:hypothetical protein
MRARRRSQAVQLPFAPGARSAMRSRGSGPGSRGYVMRLEDNLLAGIARSQIELGFGAGAGRELVLCARG